MVLKQSIQTLKTPWPQQPLKKDKPPYTPGSGQTQNIVNTFLPADHLLILKRSR